MADASSTTAAPKNSSTDSSTTTAPAPTATPPAASTSTTSDFVPLPQDQIDAMTPAEQSAYLDQQTAAQNGTAPPPPAATSTTSPPTPAQIKAGKLTPDQISQLSYQDQINYRNAQNRNQTTSGASSTYTPPPPAAATNYTSTQTFVPEVPANEPTATNWNVTPDQTVQGQMTKLTTDLQTNPVYQSLAEQMKRVQAAQGGGNSLMAESAAYDKVIGLAYNIAVNDAGTYAKSAEFNASMANQFGLAEQQFIHTALLSDQNYKQSQVLQSEQIKGNIDSVDRQVAGQLEATRIAGKYQVQAAGAQVAAASVYAQASVTNAKLSSETSLKEAAMSQQTTLDSLQIGFQSNWALNQQQEGNTLTTIGAQAGAQINVQRAGAQDQIAVNASAAQDQFAKQLTLQNNADMNANLRQLMAGVATIGATPGLTPEQQANAIKTETTIFQTNQSLTNAAATSTTYGMRNGSIGLSLSGGPLPTPSSSDPYSNYGNYMTFPGFNMTAPPTLPFFGGTGTSTSPLNQQPPQAQPLTGPTFIPPPTVAPPAPTP